MSIILHRPEVFIWVNSSDIGSIYILMTKYSVVPIM